MVFTRDLSLFSFFSVSGDISVSQVDSEMILGPAAVKAPLIWLICQI